MRERFFLNISYMWMTDDSGIFGVIGHNHDMKRGERKEDKKEKRKRINEKEERVKE